MRMDGQQESSNVEDVRGMSGGRGGGIGFPIGGRGIGLGTVVVALVAGWIFGINPLALLGLAGGGGGSAVQQAPEGPLPQASSEEPQVRFVKQVLGSTEQVWARFFTEAGRQYQPPRLAIFRQSYQTACGQGVAQMGPFYCPVDQKIYIDLRFYDTLERKIGAPGQFAQAYVIAHEVAHHVQNQLGVMKQVDAARQRGNEARSNALSVRVELQADCYAGVWAKRSQAENGWRLEAGDIESGLNAASQIGDDTLQRQSQGAVVPESFTHGTSAQRVGWFKRGFESGDPSRCDTFDGRDG